MEAAKAQNWAVQPQEESLSNCVIVLELDFDTPLSV
jgi:hypothetical protein